MADDPDDAESVPARPALAGAWGPAHWAAPVPADFDWLEESCRTFARLLPGFEGTLREMLANLPSGCQLDRVHEALMFTWSEGLGELLRRGLVHEAIPGTVTCDRALANLADAADEVLRLTALPAGDTSLPDSSTRVGAQINRVLRTIRALHGRTADLIACIRVEVRWPHRLQFVNAGKGRPRAWYMRAKPLLVDAGLSAREADRLLRRLADEMGLRAPTPRRAT